MVRERFATMVFEPRLPRSVIALQLKMAIMNNRVTLTRDHRFVDHSSARNRWTHPELPGMLVARCTWKGEGKPPFALYSLRCDGRQLYAEVDFLVSP